MTELATDPVVFSEKTRDVRSPGHWSAPFVSHVHPVYLHMPNMYEYEYTVYYSVYIYLYIYITFFDLFK